MIKYLQIFTERDLEKKQILSFRHNFIQPHGILVSLKTIEQASENFQTLFASEIQRIWKDRRWNRMGRGRGERFLLYLINQPRITGREGAKSLHAIHYFRTRTNHKYFKPSPIVAAVRQQAALYNVLERPPPSPPPTRALTHELPLWRVSISRSGTTRRAPHSSFSRNWRSPGINLRLCRISTKTWQLLQNNSWRPENRYYEYR